MSLPFTNDRRSIMKRWFFGLLCLALANPAWAQNPVVVESPPGNFPVVQPLSKGAVVATPATTGLQAAPLGPPTAQVVTGNACGPACAPGCTPVCHVPMKTI